MPKKKPREAFVTIPVYSMDKFIPTENVESEHFATWLRLKGLRFTHVANESGLPKRVAYMAAVRKKRMGVSPGFPDFIVYVPSGTLYIEMKRIKGSKTSPEQKEWIEFLQSVPGSEAKIVKGYEEAVAFVKEHL